MIKINFLSKKYKNIKALQDINLQFSQGQSICLIGPNGSGKTTLIKCLLGLVYPDAGTITVQSIPITSGPSYRNKIGYMPQIGRYPDHMKVSQLFNLMRAIRPSDSLRLDYELYELFNLDQINNQRMHTLSGGTRQKVSAALAFLFDPEILILDEPTAGLDPLSSEILKKKIVKEKGKNKLILITSHILSDLDDLCTHVIYLQEGRLLFFKDFVSLQLETKEQKLNKAIALIMKSNNTIASK